MSTEVMTKQRTAKHIVALITIFGLLFMHDVTPAMATAPHCQGTPERHHDPTAANHREHTVVPNALPPSAGHDACIGVHSNHSCVGVTRKAIQIPIDASHVVLDHDNADGGNATTTTNQVHSGLPPPPPNLSALCISRT